MQYWVNIGAIVAWVKYIGAIAASIDATGSVDEALWLALEVALIIEVVRHDGPLRIETVCEVVASKGVQRGRV
jgi:hypothetical protein